MSDDTRDSMTAEAMQVGAMLGPRPARRSPLAPNAPSGFEAMGQPVPHYRKSAALAHVRQMVPGIATAEATSLIDRMVYALERDDPYRAQRAGLAVLDLTGTYRMMAVLLTDPEPAA